MVDRVCVNLYSGPGGGKTTAAASLFTRLKKIHVDCELVAEVAKDLVLEGNTRALRNQIYVFAHQLYRLQCAYENTRVVIVDSPLLLSAIYNPDTSAYLTPMVFEQYREFNNMNLFVRRSVEYPHSMSGRIHSLTESITIDNKILNLLDSHDVPYVYYDETMEDALVHMICDEIGHVPPDDL